MVIIIKHRSRSLAVHLLIERTFSKKPVILCSLLIIASQFYEVKINFEITLTLLLQKYLISNVTIIYVN